VVNSIICSFSFGSNVAACSLKINSSCAFNLR
jgi:hypothetical protein